MNKLAGLLFGIAFFLLAIGQGGVLAVENKEAKQTAAKATKDAPAKDIIISARLVELPGTMPPNDLYNYVYIMKFRVLQVEKGKLDGKEIFVGQYNPLIPRSKIKDKMDSKVNGNAKKFTAGSKYKLTLIAPLEDSWSGPVEDEYFDNTDVRYFATNTDVIGP